MELKLITDKAPFDISLRNASLYVAIFFLASIVFGALIQTNSLNHTPSLLGFLIELIGNLCLLFGALWYNQWLVLVWLIQAIFFFINWPIAFLGVIFNFGGYRHAAFFKNIILVLIEYIITLLIFAYVARIVYSFWHQLRNTTSTTQHSVVV